MRIGLVGLGRIGELRATCLLDLPHVDTLVLADARPDAASGLVGRLGPSATDRTEVCDPDELTAADLDALVVSTATAGHEEWIRRAVAARLPTLCEKPAAADLAATLALAALVAEGDVPVQIGFQRRFDAGYRAAREVVGSGRLGFVHTLRVNTHDASPPPPEFIATSGGIFGDCGVHDVDAVRFVTGREVVSAYATGSNQGAAHFAAAGDVDTGAAVLTLDDGGLVLLSATRYNGAGYDVRMEVMAERDSLGVGLDGSLALRSVEPGPELPARRPHATFIERFGPAFRTETAAFVELATGGPALGASLADALAAFRVAEACERSRAERRPVDLAEIKGA